MIEMNNQQLKARFKAGDAIEGAVFPDVDWSDLDCQSANFVGCRFEEAHFPGAIFAAAGFTRCQFNRCRFPHADLSDATFDECVFATRDDPPTGCAFAFSDLRRAKFLRSDLSLCEFERCDLFSIEVDHCVLRGARFHKADFSHAYSRKVVVTRATFRACDMELADLAEARLAECDFTGTRLREADLGSADLTDAVLRDCDLFRAELTGTKLEGADLRGAEISGLNLLNLSSFARMKINQNQQHILLSGIDLDIHLQYTPDIQRQAAAPRAAVPARSPVCRNPR